VAQLPKELIVDKGWCTDVAHFVEYGGSFERRWNFLLDNHIYVSALILETHHSDLPDRLLETKQEAEITTTLNTRHYKYLVIIAIHYLAGYSS